MYLKTLLQNRSGSVKSTILVVALVAITAGVVSMSQYLTNQKVDVQTRAAGYVNVALQTAGNLITNTSAPNYICRPTKGEWCVWNSSNAAAQVTDSGQLQLIARNMASGTGACWIYSLNVNPIAPRRYNITANVHRTAATTSGQAFISTEIRNNANLHIQPITASGTMNYVVDIPTNTDVANIKFCLWEANYATQATLTLNQLTVTQSTIPVAPITCTISMPNPPQFAGNTYTLTGNVTGGNGNYTYLWRSMQGANFSIPYGPISATNTNPIQWTAPTDLSLGTIGAMRLEVRDSAGASGYCQLGLQVYQPTPTQTPTPTSVPLSEKVRCTADADCGCGIDLGQTNTNMCVFQNKQYLSTKFRCASPDFCSGVTGTCAPRCVSGTCQKVCPAPTATATPIPTAAATPGPVKPAVTIRKFLINPAPGAGIPTVAPGSEVVYRLSATNGGGQTAINVSIIEDLATQTPNLTFVRGVSITYGGGATGPTSPNPSINTPPTIKWMGITMPVNSTVDIDFVVKVSNQCDMIHHNTGNINFSPQSAPNVGYGSMYLGLSRAGEEVQVKCAATATPEPTKPYCYLRSKGDVTCDNQIDGLDFTCWRNKYIDNVNDPICIDTDFDGLRGTNLVDFTIWKINNDLH